MADLWFRKLGFSRNPFTIKPAAFSYELFGADITSVISGIEEGRMLFVEAPLGYGKTTLLKGIIHSFGGRKKVIYAHVLPSEKLDVKGLLKHSSVANLVTGSLSRGMILVVDEAQNILAESSSEILEFYKSGNIRAVVFFGTNYSQDSFGKELGTVLNGNVVRLSKPTPEQAISMVRSRIGNLSVISNDDILSAYKNAQGSPRRLLQLCEDVCRAAIEGRQSPLAVIDEHESLQAKAEPIKPSNSPRKKAKKAAKLRRKKAVARKARVSPTHLVSVPVSVVEKEEPKIKLRLKKPVLAESKKAVLAVDAKAMPAKAKARQKKRKLVAPQATVPAASEPQESTEGRYWGEFMGMQK